MLFNSHGFVNVTLRDIATKAGLSTGNLAYHYRNKDVIIDALYHQMMQSQSDLISGIKLIPSFENIDRQMVRYLDFQTTYRFFFLDTLELCRAYTRLAQVYRTNVSDQVRNIRAIMDYSIGSGNMNPESTFGLYDQIATNVWMTLSFWLQQSEVLGKHKNTSKAARTAVWSMVLPHLTKQGLQNFEAVANKLKLPINKIIL